MPSLTDELIERVEKATGPDRGLDALVCWYFNGTWEQMKGDERLRDMEGLRADLAQAEDYQIYTCEPVTSSLDAALSLVERVMPGRAWMVREYTTPERGWTAYVCGEDGCSVFSREGVKFGNPALAVLSRDTAERQRA